jgi:hypothetical protein
MLSDGTRLEGKEVQKWFADNAQPQLGNHQLLDAKNPLRWLRDNALPPPSPPEAFVEFLGGDRLPGRVLEYRDGSESPYERLPAHFVIDQNRYELRTPPRESLRATTRWLRRVVWQRRGDERFAPGTLFARDGRQLKFRSLRWQQTAVRVLLEEGTAELPFSQIAELHLPRQDPWNACYEQLAILSPDGAARLVHLETSDGLKATASTERFEARANGPAGDSRFWLHMLQPAWSLDPLWLRFQTIHLRRHGPPEHVALSDVELIPEAEVTLHGGHWGWRLDRNVQGGLLRNGGNDFGWGIGTHAPLKLQVPLPAAARVFRTRLGLDEIAGRGGCARGLVLLGDAGKPHFQSELLVGAEKTVSAPAIAIPSGGQRTLTLVTDPALKGRPKGADPLNIRDMLDWLEPELELDKNALQREIRRRAVAAIPTWEGWTVSGDKSDAAEAVQLLNRWDKSEPAGEAFRIEVLPGTAAIKLSRTVRIRDSDRWLCLCVSRFPDGTTPAKIEVRIDTKRVASFDVPLRAPGSDPEPLLISLREYRGREAKIEISQLAAGPQAKVDWRSIAILPHRPGLLPLFEEQASFAKSLTDGEAAAAVENQDRHAGLVCLKVTPSDKGAEKGGHNLAGLPVEIRERPRLGQYRYVRFAWKKKGGTRICLQLGHDGHFGPEEDASPSPTFRYDAGTGPVSYKAALRIATAKPSEWTVVTRDLYADFGKFTLTGLSFAAVDGDYALFDHIYLGRSMDDFQRIEVTTSK